MPRGDRTGPAGMGPLTGRRLGYCSDYQSPGFTRGWEYGRGGGGWGRGRGGGRGRGWGRGYGYYGRESYPYPPSPPPPIAPQNEKAYLEQVLKSLSDELEAVKKRLGELSSKEE